LSCFDFDAWCDLAAHELARMLGDRLEALAGHLRQLDEQTGVLQKRVARRGGT